MTCLTFQVTKISVRCLTTEERLEQTPDTTLTDLLLREEEKPESASCFWFQVGMCSL